MNAPQLIYICLVAIGLGITMQQHGKPKTGNHSLPLHMLATCMSIGLLYWGGFFSGGAA